ncbi:MAG: hypothetical protein JWN56_820 [Sphingobacteriales bacterium]|nr:hypothetical protein [Sphingobacteriales bacterium]
MLSFGIASLSLFTFSSCGTVASSFSGGKRPSFIVNAPQDVIVKLDGTPLDLSSELFTSSVNIGAKATTDFSTAAVNLPYKKAITLEISSPSTGRTGTIELKPKGSSAIFWGNLIFAPIVGHIIDGVTGNSKTLRPKYIDVTSVLNKVSFKDWPSQGQLKRREKDLIKGK